MATAIARTQPEPRLYPAGTLALSPEQAAQALGVTRTKIFGLLASGALRGVKIGKYRRIPTTELEAFLQRELDAQSA